MDVVVQVASFNNLGCNESKTVRSNEYSKTLFILIDISLCQSCVCVCVCGVCVVSERASERACESERVRVSE